MAWGSDPAPSVPLSLHLQSWGVALLPNPLLACCERGAEGSPARSLHSGANYLPETVLQDACLQAQKGGEGDQTGRGRVLPGEAMENESRQTEQGPVVENSSLPGLSGGFLWILFFSSCPTCKYVWGTVQTRSIYHVLGTSGCFF